jgi:hypothetical protein
MEVREETALSRATVRVMFPIDPERSFIEGQASRMHRFERRGEQEDA